MSVISNTQKELLSIQEELKLQIETNQSQNSQIDELVQQAQATREDVSSLAFKQQELAEKADYLSHSIGTLTTELIDDYVRFSKELSDTNSTLAANYNSMDMRTLWGGGLLTLTILGFGIYLFVRRRSDSTSMNGVRKVQEALQAAQTKLQEDSLKLDNQMIALMEKQMNATSTREATETDHSLALKVADEIVRIELNLSRMDSSIKGHKQLSKAVERIKNNFQANGYEIVDMLGKAYNEGMKVVANFVLDDTLKEGEQVITGVTKPQINYNGKMIQTAQIIVSQNI